MGVCKNSEFDPVVQTGTGLLTSHSDARRSISVIRRHANNAHSAKKSEVDLP